jgi:hypothetical protein
MNDYNFSTLNDKEFELLTLDILNKSLQFELHSFKDGKDKGIDLRYATCGNNNEVVVQVKHLINSEFAQLKFSLKNSELPKVIKLKPARYIVVTSLALTAGQTDEIKVLMAPYIISSQDIIHQSTLNNELRNHPDIEENHFKLWFSSTTVLKGIFNNAMAGRTKAYLEKIQLKINYYVVTRRLDEAAHILDKEKLLLISGQPGIGKSTLADVLFFAKAKNGYKIFKVYNIEEAEKAISKDDEEKQLFYYDDFLGEIYYQVLPTSQHDASLTAFVERIKSTPNKYLILTTRTVILTQATQKSEQINHSDISGLQFELKLNDYSAFEKAQILYNHIYSRGLNSDTILAVTKDRFYTQIISHVNYTPRIIESITKPQTVNAFKLEEYREFILNNLKNPEKIWSSSFHNQIHYFDQRLLMTLFTCPYGMEDEKLQTAFESRMAYENSENNQVIKSNQYRDSINTLLNGFITSSLVTQREFLEDDKVKREFKLINPSLSDYIAAYVKGSHLEKKGILCSAIYIEQLVHFNPQNGLLPMEKDLQTIIRDRIASGELDSLDQYKEYRFHGLVLETLCRYCVDVSIDHLLLEYLQKIDFTSNLWWIKDNLMYLLLNLGDAPMTKSFIVGNFQMIIESLIKVIENEQGAKKVPDVFTRYGIDYGSYIASPAAELNLISMLEKASSYRESITKMVWQDKVKDLTAVENLYQALEKDDTHLAYILIGSHHATIKSPGIDQEFWSKKIEANLVKENNELSHQTSVTLFKDPQIKPNKEKNAIDLLFSTLGWEQLPGSIKELSD